MASPQADSFQLFSPGAACGVLQEASGVLEARQSRRADCDGQIVPRRADCNRQMSAKKN